MPSTYTSNNGIEKPANGEQSNTWGDSANNDFDLIDQSLDGIATVTLSGTTSTLAITSGASSDGRNRMIVFDGTLSAAHTVTVTPNTSEKWYFMTNGTSGGYSVTVRQGSGSGTTVVIPSGVTMLIRLDGTGTNANVTEAMPSPYFGGSMQIAGALNVAGGVTSSLSGCTGLPVSTGISGLGTGVAAFLATPTSANLAAAITNETGTGSAVFNTSPTLVTPSIGDATASSISITGLSSQLFSSSGTVSFQQQPISPTSYIIGTTSNHPLVLYTNSTTRLTVETTGALTSSTGASLTAGGAWTNASDAELKQSFESVSDAAVLDSVFNLPVLKWEYKAEPGVKHIGPTAQDFKQAFGVGANDTSISTVDAIGVLLTAVKELYRQVKLLS